MHFQDFDMLNRKRCESPQGFNHKLEDWMTAVVGEIGEAANIIKKLNRVRDGKPGNKQSPEELRTALAGELADADIYLSLLYQAAGIDRETAIATTFNRKSAEIGYQLAV